MKQLNSITFLIFWGLIALLSLGGLLEKDADISENENRVLARRPSFSFNAWADGSFQEGIEAYLQDHVPGRDGWGVFHAAAVLATGDPENGGAYAGKDGFIFEKVTEAEVDPAMAERNIEAARGFLGRQAARLGQGRATALIVPTSALVYADKVPRGAPLFDERGWLKKAREGLGDFASVDLAALYAHRGGGGVEDPFGALYYRTDHHWTTHGAYLAYAAWSGSAAPEEEWQRARVTDRFRGSLYSKLLAPGAAWDSIERYDGPRGGTLWLEGPGGGEARPEEATDGGKRLDGAAGGRGAYDDEKLKTKDKYAYFLGGNEAVATILREGGRPEGGKERRLVIVKDSFANVFATLAAEDYERTTLVDLRYFTGDLDALIEEEGATDLLLLYNIRNFITDRNVGRLAQGS